VLSQFSAGAGGGGSGKAQFDPLLVDLAGVQEGLVALLKAAAMGQHISSVELAGVKVTGNARPAELYELVLNDVTVSGYAADGDDTAVAFNYEKVTETIRDQGRDGSVDAGQSFTFNLSNGGSISPQLAGLIHAAADHFIV